MVDVNPVNPRMPPEPPPKKTDRGVDSDAFHKEMHKRVEKVTETDQEQKKKRKRQEEAEEEDEPKEIAAPTTPPQNVTPFSMEGDKKKVSPLMEGGGKISPLASAQQTKTPGPLPPAAPPQTMGAAFSPDEMQDDSGFLEETAFVESMPEEEVTTPAAEEPPTYTPPEEPISPPTTPAYTEEEPIEPPSGRVPMPEVETPAAPQSKAPSAQEESQTAAPSEKKDKKAAQPALAAPPSKAMKAAPAPEHQPTVKSEKKAKPSSITPEEMPAQKAISAEEIERMEQEAQGTGVEETGGYFEQFAKEKEKGLKREIKPTETPDELEGLEGVVTPITPLPSSDYIEKEKKDEEEVAALGAGGAPSGLETPPPPMQAAAAAVNNPYANLHPEVMDLFDRMAGTMTVMTHAGVKETVVTLDSPKFASSVFFGSQIIIQEYSSAPQAYNIQLNGSPEAIALFQGNADDLMAAFQHGTYNFRVNRLDTGLLGQKPLIRRKGPASGGKEDQDQRGSER
jgi:hypothetical protein